MNDRPIPKHRFKPHEWIQRLTKESLQQGAPIEYEPAITKVLLLEELVAYARVFGTPKTRPQIAHFLNLKHWLFPTPEPQEHHIRCIATLTGGAA